MLFLKGNALGYRVAEMNEVLTARKVAVIGGAGVNVQFLAVLCSDVPVSCAMYQSTSGDVPGLVPVENGMLPAWLGNEVSLLAAGAAGGVAVNIDGTGGTWLTGRLEQFSACRYGSAGIRKPLYPYWVSWTSPWLFFTNGTYVRMTEKYADF
jgi:hypothetical protein